MHALSPDLDVFFTNAIAVFMWYMQKRLPRPASLPWPFLRARHSPKPNSTWVRPSDRLPPIHLLFTQRSVREPEVGGAGGWPGASSSLRHALRRATRLEERMARILSWAKRHTGSHNRHASRLRETFDDVPVAIIGIGQRDEIVFANSRATELFGYGSDTLDNTPISVLFPGLHAKEAPGGGQDLLSGAAHCWPAFREQVVVARHKDSSAFTAEVTTGGCRLGDRQVRLAVIVDGSARLELHRNRQELTHLTRVSALGELAGSLAHELNQPLTAILSNAQAAQRFLEADPINVPEIRGTLGDIVADDCRAGEIIRKIRALVRKGDAELQPLDVGSVVRDVALLVHSDAVVRGIRLTVGIAGTVPPVRADRVQLQQVVLNLLLNGFDAVSDCQVADRVVAAEVSADPDGTVHIAVSDRGHGLTVDQLDEIFKPFVTSKPHGLGLGLSISRTIVAAHGGRLWAENNADGGACLHVALPPLSKASHPQP